MSIGCLKRHRYRLLWVLGPVLLTTAAIGLLGGGTTESEEKARFVPWQPLVSERPVVAIAKAKTPDDYEATTLAAIRMSGGLEGLVKKGSTVYIKPNIVGPSPSGAGRITDWRVVQAVVNEVRRLGATKVVVGETPIDCSWSAGFRIAGYNNLKGCELVNIDTKKADSYYLMPERSLIGQPLYLPKIYIDADVVIDIPVLKTHSTGGVTIGLKNVGIGMPPLNIYKVGGNKGGLHNFDIAKEIPDVSSIRRPDYTVVDAMVGGEGDGPVNPTPLPMGVVIAGRDIVAVDTVGTLVMGYDPYDITHLVNAAAMSRLGIMDIDKIQVVGASIAEVQKSFKRPYESDFPFKHSTIIREVVGKVTVDGNLDEWGFAWPNYIRNANQFQGDNWEGPSDLKAITYAAHDWENLYVAFDVTDNSVVAGDAGTAAAGGGFSLTSPNQDGVELALSFSMARTKRGLRTRRVAGKDFLLLAGLSDGEKTGVSVIDQVTNAPLPGLVASATRTATGYSVEMKIPISSLGLKGIKLRDELWIDFGVTDVDAAGAGLKTQATWTAPWKTAKWTSSSINNPSNAGFALIDATVHPWNN